MELSVIIPVYNGARSIERLVKELVTLDIEGGLEIVLVNDCSPDNSWEIIQGIHHTATIPVVAIDLARNFGEHNAVMAGYAAATGRFLINIDDDFQHRPSEVRKLYEHARSHKELDVVYTYYGQKHHSLFRNVGSWFNDGMARYVLNKPKGLYLSSFRCINRFLKDKILNYTGPYPYIDGLILENTQHIGQLKVEHAPRAEGRSGYTLRKLVRLWLIIFVNFSVMPLRISSIMGLVVSAAGFIMAISAFIESVVTDTPQGWASILAAVMVFSGIQLVMLGLIGEYLGRLYLMHKGKPQYSIRTVLRTAGQ